jgi:TRAP-type mannitol/chloroaromatic compound transport system permease large subunit
VGPGGGGTGFELALIHSRIVTSEHRVVSPSICARAIEAIQVGLEYPFGGAAKGSVGAMIACQSERRVSAQTERDQSVGRVSQSAGVAIDLVGPGDPCALSRLNR